jgi:predicted dehydrogenase
VKAYDNPQDAANDPDVDLVVISVNVAKHYELAKPAILAGKGIFVEWPLGNNLQEAKELSELVKSKGVKNFVGLQERVDPVVTKLKDIISSGRIGQVLSTTIIACTTILGPGPVHKKIKYFLDSEGGNSVMIPFGHRK